VVPEAAPEPGGPPGQLGEGGVRSGPFKARYASWARVRTAAARAAGSHGDPVAARIVFAPSCARPQADVTTHRPVRLHGAGDIEGLHAGAVNQALAHPPDSHEPDDYEV
jgi:hypothetical protein